MHVIFYKTNLLRILILSIASFRYPVLNMDALLVNSDVEICCLVEIHFCKHSSSLFPWFCGLPILLKVTLYYVSEMFSIILFLN